MTAALRRSASFLALDDPGEADDVAQVLPIHVAVRLILVVRVVPVTCNDDAEIRKYLV